MTQCRYQQFRGSNYLELPKWVALKKAIINVKNNDEKCFMWALLSALHPVNKDPQRVLKYKQFENELKFDGIQFPVEIKDIPKIEKMNNLVINIFSNEGKEIIPIYISNKMEEVSDNKIIDLFLIKDGDKFHYCWIKNINRFLNREINSAYDNKFICRRCFVHFNVRQKYEQHLKECSKNKAVVFKEPEKDYVQFENIQRSQKIPYVVYADFESIIQNYDTTSQNSNRSWTEKKGKHIASAFCAIIVDFERKIIDKKVYRGEDAGEQFNHYIIDKSDKLMTRADEKMKVLTQKQWKSFNESKDCPECKQNYLIKNQKVRDHCHWTGEFRRPLCNSCNLKSKKNRFIPVFFHNLKGYDSHLILGSIKDEHQFDDKNRTIQIIPNNSEKYISFSYKEYKEKDYKDEDDQIKKYKYFSHEIRFLDSFSFMASSLDSLSKNLTDEKFKITKEFYQNEEKFNLMKRKGIYPYEYMNSFEKYNEIKLPSKEMFYDELNDKNVLNEDYEYAQEVWSKMRCRNLGDYTDIYMINDVLMLADVFETFRETCLKYYKLDPCWYYTAPGLAWDAMLKITEIKLQTIKYYDMYLFVEKGIRGGIVNAVKRYSKVNNKYLKNYDSKKESNYLMYLDANNLYGWAMIQNLPYDELEFEDNFDQNMNIEQLKSYIKELNNIGKGCILEVDLEYPKELHDLHNDFPFCPQNNKVNNQKMSKLMNMLYDKEKYVIHYKNLIQTLDYNLKLKKIHRVLTFKESSWMEKYIMLNTNLRKQAKNDFEKDFFKLMNNSVFGKTMENIRN